MKFRKKPVVIEAVQWLPNERGSLIGGWPKSKAWKPAKTWLVGLTIQNLLIPTLEGETVANVGDWVIKGVKGEFYACKPDIFEMTYEKVS